VFLSSDFADYGAIDSVRTAMQRLVKKGVLMRYAKGIYYYPKIDKKFSMGVLKPSIDTVAKSIAKRDRARIVPTGVYALNRLGLSTQVPANAVYLTDGTPRRIKIGNSNGILFIHTAPKNLAFKSDIAMLLTFALKEIGKDRLTDEHFERLRYIFSQVPKEKFLQDIILYPEWIKHLIFKHYE
jgi:hypothetical protein